MEQVPGQPSLGSEGDGKQKTGDRMKGDMFQLQEAAVGGSFGHVALALESRVGDYWDNW